MPEVYDRRAALAEAFESAEQDEQGIAHELPEVEAAPVADAERDGSADPGVVEAAASTDKPISTRKAGEPPIRTKGVPPAQRLKEADTTNDPAKDPAKPASNLDKPPQSWGVARDNLWAKVTDPEVRAVIAKRELEIQQGMSRAGNIQRVAEEYAGVVKPFENIFHSMGVTPRQAIHEVMTTAAGMIVGTQQQKADIMAEMFSRYGVDIGMLDEAITRRIKNPQQPQQQQPQHQAPPAWAAPLIDMQRQFQANMAQRETQQREAASAEIQAMESKPYFGDIKEDIADVMEIAGRRGVVLSLEQAYQKAIQLNPQVSKLVQGRQSTTTASEAGRTLASARRRASTVRGAPSSASLSGKPASRREALAQAWDAS